ncbi:MAG TPA: hypothetical protein DIU15_13035, partial [Deltaproteobacteria bacterium]|nr:hypothetical protein [Deltaproteobacteria bacterium]
MAFRLLLFFVAGMLATAAGCSDMTLIQCDEDSDCQGLNICTSEGLCSAPSEEEIDGSDDDDDDDTGD